MDMVNRRLHEIVPTGTPGAPFPWAVSDEVARAAAGPDGVTRLVFEPGDAILFDEMNLHRTAADPGMTLHRLAVECWFFAPSHYPLAQYPMLV